MGKIKKKFKKKINPEKSNKMIYAVVGGLIIFFTVLVILMTSSKTPRDKKELISNTLSYINSSGGINETKIYPDTNRVVIVYNSFVKKVDFVSIARFAALKLSNKLKGEEIEVVLSKDEEKDTEYSFISKNGRMISERVLKKSED